MKTISSFRGKYLWASNFSSYGFWYDNVWYPTNEHWFQAMKTLNQKERVQISHADTPGIARKMGSPNGYKGFKIKLRADWKLIYFDVMLYGLRKKFSRHLEIAKKLIATYPKYLVEENWWHDNIWGNCRCKDCKNITGKNLLGKALMYIRLELILERKEME